MNTVLQGTGHKSFVLGFNDIKVKEQIQTLYKVSSNDLEFQTQIQDIKNTQILSQSYHLENGYFLDTNTQSKLISFENFLNKNYADFRYFYHIDFIEYDTKYILN